MPRKSISRAFKLACKHYRGFDHSFATKAIATRKLQASQGAVNQKLASSSDARHGTTSGKPLVRSFASSHSFAAHHPVSARTRSATKHLAGYHSSSAPHPGAGSQHPAAPSFAAAPVWQREEHVAQHPRAAPSPFQMDTEMAEAASPSRNGGQDLELKNDPVYQYAQMTRRDSKGEPKRLALTRRTSDRLALKWYGSLDRRPIVKVSSGRPSSPLSPPPGERARIAAAWSAYAKLNKH